MSKKIGIEGLCAYYFYTVKKTKRPMGEINEGFYRFDDKFFCTQSDAPNAIIIFRNGSTQPQGPGEFMDPDLSKIYIDSMKCAKKKTFKFGNITLNKILPFIVVGAVVISIIYTIAVKL